MGDVSSDSSRMSPGSFSRSSYSRLRREKKMEAKRRGRKFDSDADDDSDDPRHAELDPYFQHDEDVFEDPFFKVCETTCFCLSGLALGEAAVTIAVPVPHDTSHALKIRGRTIWRRPMKRMQSALREDRS